MQLLPAGLGQLSQPVRVQSAPGGQLQRCRHPGHLDRTAALQLCSSLRATAQDMVSSNSPRNAQPEARPPSAKPRVVVIGTGWGAISMIKALPKSISDVYDIAVVSPRSYFLFTALLPAAAFGTVETRSIVEAARKLIQGKATYYEAACTSIDTEERTIQACFPSHAGLEKHCFQLPYDILIHCPGSCNNTFGISGVREHTFMFKSIEDAQALRQRVCECFERSALPGTSDEEKGRLLTFVVVGGGPTGVEVAAELHDVMSEDLRRYYPQLVSKHARVILVELSDHILSSYDRAIGEYASQAFQRSGIELVLNSRVSEVTKNELTILCPDKTSKTIQFGACVWATGVAMHPLTKHLAEQLPEQDNFRSIICDPYLRVRGGGGSIYALGDAATIAQPRALEHAQDLFDKADANKDGLLQLDELRGILRSASKEYPHLEEHAKFLDQKYGGQRWGGFVLDKLRGGAQSNGASSPVEALLDNQPVSREQFEGLLETIDQGLRALPATGSVAGQEGSYLAGLLKSKAILPDQPLPASVAPFKYKLGNSVAYIGGSQAVMDVPSFGILTGKQAGVAWRGFEVYRQISFRNQCLVVGDWIKGRLFGRDVEFALAETEL